MATAKYAIPEGVDGDVPFGYDASTRLGAIYAETINTPKVNTLSGTDNALLRCDATSGRAELWTGDGTGQGQLLYSQGYDSGSHSLTSKGWTTLEPPASNALLMYDVSGNAPAWYAGETAGTAELLAWDAANATWKGFDHANINGDSVTLGGTSAVSTPQYLAAQTDPVTGVFQKYAWVPAGGTQVNTTWIGMKLLAAGGISSGTGDGVMACFPSARTASLDSSSTLSPKTSSDYNFSCQNTAPGYLYIAIRNSSGGTVTVVLMNKIVDSTTAYVVDPSAAGDTQLDMTDGSLQYMVVRFEDVATGGTTTTADLYVLFAVTEASTTEVAAADLS